MSNDSVKLLKIEAQRAQTFLFKVPRLAEMDGANALLGDLFRQRLPLALEAHLAIPSGLEKTSDKYLKGGLTAAKGDPVANDAASSRGDGKLTSTDVPYETFRRGILVRDGGRFWALIKADKIEEAKHDAAAIIHDHCPGLGYALHVGDLDPDGVLEDTPSESATDLVALPCFRWSEDGGDEPASKEIRIGEDLRVVARSSVQKREARKTSSKGEAGGALWDIASILRSGKHVPVPDDQDAATVDLTGIAANRYLAVIHMDGNAIGQRSMKYAQDVTEKDFLSRQARMEAFFFGMRSAMRSAVISALNEHFNDAPEHYRLLMLGGDDVLLVCRADRALPLVISVAKKLKAYQLADGQALTMGAGIAIGKPKLPFHRLHEIAEQLASSAKRIALDPEGERRSVVDWLITTSSWVDDIDAHRSRWERIRYRVGENSEETLLLTGKPYPVLEPEKERQTGKSQEPSLEALADFSKTLRGKFYTKNSHNEGIRSQLKHFLSEIRKGKVYAELAWAKLPEKVRKYFKEQSLPGFQRPDLNGQGLWIQLNNSVFRSWVADAIELVELEQIGRRRKSPIGDQAAASPDKEEAA